MIGVRIRRFRLSDPPTGWSESARAGTASMLCTQEPGWPQCSAETNIILPSWLQLQQRTPDRHQPSPQSDSTHLTEARPASVNTPAPAMAMPQACFTLSLHSPAPSPPAPRKPASTASPMEAAGCNTSKAIEATSSAAPALRPWTKKKNGTGDGKGKEGRCKRKGNQARRCGGEGRGEGEWTSDCRQEEACGHRLKQTTSWHRQHTHTARAEGE